MDRSSPVPSIGRLLHCHFRPHHFATANLASLGRKPPERRLHRDTLHRRSRCLSRFTDAKILAQQAHWPSRFLTLMAPVCLLGSRSQSNPSQLDQSQRTRLRLDPTEPSGIPQPFSWRSLPAPLSSIILRNRILLPLGSLVQTHGLPKKFGQEKDVIFLASRRPFFRRIIRDRTSHHGRHDRKSNSIPDLACHPAGNRPPSAPLEPTHGPRHSASPYAP